MYIDLNYLYLAIIVISSLVVGFGVYYYKYPPKIKPIKSKNFQTPQGSIFYELHGKEGPYIVLIHGLGASSYCWRNVVTELQKKYRVLTVDLLGFGKSDKISPMSIDLLSESLYSLLKELEIKEFYWAGHSLGCQIGVWLTHQNPQLVLKFVLVSPAIHPKVVPRLFKRASWLAHFSPLIVRPNLIKTILRRVVNSKTEITLEMLDAYHTPYKDPKAHLSFASAVEMLKDQRPFRVLSEIHKPCKILWGDRDRIVHRRMIMDIQNELKDCELSVLPGSYHLPLEDDPSWVAKEILNFIKD